MESIAQAGGSCEQLRRRRKSGASGKACLGPDCALTSNGKIVLVPGFFSRNSAFCFFTSSLICFFSSVVSIFAISAFFSARNSLSGLPVSMASIRYSDRFSSMNAW